MPPLERGGMEDVREMGRGSAASPLQGYSPPGRGQADSWAEIFMRTSVKAMSSPLHNWDTPGCSWSELGGGLKSTRQSVTRDIKAT